MNFYISSQRIGTEKIQLEIYKILAEILFTKSKPLEPGHNSFSERILRGLLFELIVSCKSISFLSK